MEVEFVCVIFNKFLLNSQIYHDNIHKSTSFCIRHHTYFCASCLSNENTVIDTGDRINLNRQSIIGRIGCRVHKIRNPKSHQIYMIIIQGHTYTSMQLLWKRRYTIATIVEKTIYGTNSMRQLVKVLPTTPIRSGFNKNIYHFPCKRYITFSVLSFSKKKDNHRIENSIRSRLLMHRLLK